MTLSSPYRLVLIILSVAGTARGADYYVAANGKPDAIGTEANPWDIVSTLAGEKPVKPGDTVWLRGGTYRCERAYETNGQGYRVTLSGTAESPIVIRAAIGERVTVDGGLVVQGDHLCLRDIEIAQPDDTPRVTGEAGSHPDLGNPLGGLTVYGSDCRAINLLVQNNLGNGVSWWSSAKGGELYGCVIVRNGWKGPDRNHGHCIYTQNQEGTKTISNCIMTTRWPGGHYTMHAYGSSRAYVDNFVIENNIAWRHGSFLVGGGRPSKNIVVRNNYLYRVPMQIGYSAPHNEHCELVSNTLFRSSISVNRYRSGIVRDNFLVGGRIGATGDGNVDVQKNIISDSQMPDEAQSILLPNKYHKRRANLAIFNWQNEEQVRVPTQGFLKPGDRFRLMDPLDLYGEPVFESECEEDCIVVPTADEFSVYVVLIE